MELFQVDITGFRKFKEKVEFKTRGKVLAILGANEAGKSSLLKALTHLNSNSPFEPYEKSTGTDGSNIGIEAKFMLSDDDREAAGVPNARWFSITKCADGERIWSISPRPDDRDYSHRAKLHKEISKIEKNANAASILADEDEGLLSETKRYFSAIGDRKTDLSETENAVVSDIASRWQGVINKDSPRYLRAFADQLNVALGLENAQSARLKAGNVLWERLPEFFFLVETIGTSNRHMLGLNSPTQFQMH